MKTIATDALLDKRRRGFDENTLASQYDLSRADEAQQILNAISKAFDGVVLGNGIGLYQAQAIDDHQSVDVQLEARRKDEKIDWRKLTSNQLNHCNSSLSFFDAEGMRFHLPAFLLAELMGEYDFGMTFCLTHFKYLGHTQFAVLTPSQREAFRDFLIFLLDEPDYESDRKAIRRALDTYWTEESCK